MRHQHRAAVPVDESIVKSKLEDEVAQLRLNLTPGVLDSIWIGRENADRVYRLTIHPGEYCLYFCPSLGQ